MKIVYQISEIKDLLMQERSQNKTIGFVPTMGALHEGHLSLLEHSQSKCDISIVSIFVNPTQFNDPKDFLKYPKLLDQDIELLENKKCDILFCPSVEEMYPNGLEERVDFSLGNLEEVLEGEKRKGHYQGVMTILNTLFETIEPDFVFMGQKDFQQVLVVKTFAKALFPKIEIVSCPTERDSDGLAKSSRNLRLSAEERKIALNISKSLFFIKDHVGNQNPAKIIDYVKKEYLDHPLIQLEYLELRHSRNLDPLSYDTWPKKEAVLLIAAFVGPIRLIDVLLLFEE
jgi:pantoate--beta-alanine ligase